MVVGASLENRDCFTSVLHSWGNINYATAVGFGTDEAHQIAHLMADVLEAPENEAVIQRVAGDVTALCRRFPVYGPSYRP